MQELFLMNVSGIIKVDALSWVMFVLISFVSLNVGIFSINYLNGDRAKNYFFLHLFLLVGIVIIMVSADHLLLFFVSWAAVNVLITRLMIHKYNWKAAKESGILVLKNFILGMLFLGTAFICLYKNTGSTSIHTILQLKISNNWNVLILILLFLAAMTQSAIIPFHKWLISSLNSPTPVSAIMHAGIINGGGFLLLRFATLFVNNHAFMQIIFFFGLFTALVGTIWKLMQHDVKRMLASSTLGQMGYMMLQFGLGLIPAALAHLCWHGLFKAYLFLSSGSAAQEKRMILDNTLTLPIIIKAIICGFCGMTGFMYANHKSFSTIDSSIFLIGITFLSGTQLAISLLQNSASRKLPFAIVFTTIAGFVYGLTVYLIEYMLAPLNLIQPQPLSVLHLIGFCLLTVSWLVLLFQKLKHSSLYKIIWMKKAYVYMLNASQPHPKTITAHHNHYQY